MTVTFSSPHGFRRGQFIATNGKTYRIVAVPSSTTIIVARPWWIGLHPIWIHGQRPFVWLWGRWIDFWYRLRYGWDDDS